MTTYSDLVRQSVLKQPVYKPGKPIEMVAVQLGIAESQILKLASNENHLGPSPKAIAAAQQALGNCALYPENSCYFLKERLAKQHGITPEHIMAGHGSSEVISTLSNAFVSPGVEVVMSKHAFISYKITTLLHEGTPVEVPTQNYGHDLDAMREAITEKTRLLFVASPNNPTGVANSAEDIENFANNLPDHVIFCYDGAYEEFLEKPPKLLPLINEGKKIILLRTFSKIYGLAGFRVGYGIAAPELIALLERVRPPFNVNSVAQTAALAALDDTEFVRQSLESNRQGMKQLEEGFTKLGIEWVPSKGNFILARFTNAKDTAEQLQHKGIIVRPVAEYDLPEHLRITIGSSEQNKRLLDELAN